MNYRLVNRYIKKMNRLEEEIYILKGKQREIISIMNHNGFDVIGKSYGLPYPTYSVYRQENDEILEEFWGK